VLTLLRVVAKKPLTICRPAGCPSSAARCARTFVFIDDALLLRFFEPYRVFFLWPPRAKKISVCLCDAQASQTILMPTTGFVSPNGFLLISLRAPIPPEGV